jgi:hypothetical protein
MFLGIGHQRALEETARLRKLIDTSSFVQVSHALKIQAHRIGMRSVLGAARLGSDQLRVQLTCKPRDNFVLHIEQVGDGLVEALGPEMCAPLRVDKLHVNAKSVA